MHFVKDSKIPNNTEIEQYKLISFEVFFLKALKLISFYPDLPFVYIQCVFFFFYLERCKREVNSETVDEKALLISKFP